MNALRFLLAVVPLCLWGEALLSFSAPRALRGVAARAGAAFVLGSAVATLAAFGLLWAGVRLETAVFGVAALSIPALLLARRFASTPDTGPPRLRAATRDRTLRALFGAAVALEVGVAAAAASVSPLTAWDAWVNFASKARILVAEGALVPALHADVARLATNLDYPLLLPVQEAWTFTFLPSTDERAAGMLSVLWYAALLAMFHGAARRVCGPTAALGFTALLATAPRLSRGAAAGLADVPLAAMVLLAFVLLSEASGPGDGRTSRARNAVAALAIGLLPWLKNEGWIWLALLLAVWLLRRGHGALAPAAIAIAAALVWPLYLGLHGTTRYVYDAPAALARRVDRVPAVARAMASRLLNPYWNFVWPLAGLTLLARRGAAFRARDAWVAAPAALYLAIVSAAFLLSRFDPYLAHVDNSAERLILHALPLAVWWLAAQAAHAGWVAPGD